MKWECGRCRAPRYRSRPMCLPTGFGPGPRSHAAPAMSRRGRLRNARAVRRTPLQGGLCAHPAPAFSWPRRRAATSGRRSPPASSRPRLTSSEPLPAPGIRGSYRLKGLLRFNRVLSVLISSPAEVLMPQWARSAGVGLLAGVMLLVVAACGGGNLGGTGGSGACITETPCAGPQDCQGGDRCNLRISPPRCQ